MRDQLRRAKTTFAAALEIAELIARTPDLDQVRQHTKGRDPNLARPYAAINPNELYEIKNINHNPVRIGSYDGSRSDGLRQYF